MLGNMIIEWFNGKILCLMSLRCFGLYISKFYKNDSEHVIQMRIKLKKIEGTREKKKGKKNKRTFYTFDLA